MLKKNPALFVGIATLGLLIAFFVVYMVRNQKVVMAGGVGVSGDPLVNEPTTAEAVETASKEITNSATA